MGKFFEHVFSTIEVKLLTFVKTHCVSQYLQTLFISINDIINDELNNQKNNFSKILCNFAASKIL